ncbi:hypothetical protein [Candidatus Endomicrobiellum trichonymphae]|uniref:hypothetical protein n=1 Tax=Endomicrobium trichonymphae TaxID=1408204 RepID=UPI00032167D6|nr:hypothetical protein [Candidatus Endomicrobium trichonymphae]
MNKQNQQEFAELYYIPVKGHAITQTPQGGREGQRKESVIGVNDSIRRLNDKQKQKGYGFSDGLDTYQEYRSYR